MRKKFLLILFLFFCLIYINSILFPAKIFADDLTVCPGESIQLCINEAIANDCDINYIYIDSGTYFEQLIINIPKEKEIYLIGHDNDSTIICRPDEMIGNVISIDGGGKIHLKNIRITNGSRSGIYINNNVTVLINNCSLENNSSSIGGGINNSGGFVSIQNSKIINNTATFSGGGIYNDGYLTIKDSLISENSVINGDGGGISNFGILNISDSSICNNTSMNYSGIAAGIGTETETLAENNWWGFESGPFNIIKNPEGEGNSVSENISFQPFLITDPFLKSVSEVDDSSVDKKNDDNSSGEKPGDLLNDCPENIDNNDENIPASCQSFQTPYQAIQPPSVNRAYFDALADFCQKNYLTLLYNTILCREPDEAGLNSWLVFLSYRKENMAKTVKYMLFSEENDSRLTSMDDPGFIIYLYSSLFFREPDSEGFNHWLDALIHGQSRKNVLTAFLESEEWKSIYSSFN